MEGRSVQCARVCSLFHPGVRLARWLGGARVLVEVVARMAEAGVEVVR